MLIIQYSSVRGMKGEGRGNKRGSVKEGNPTNEIFQYKHRPIFYFNL